MNAVMDLYLHFPWIFFLNIPRIRVYKGIGRRKGWSSGHPSHHCKLAPVKYLCNFSGCHIHEINIFPVHNR